MRCWFAIILLSVSLIGAPISMLGPDHHIDHSAAAGVDADIGAAHAEHSSDPAEFDGMRCPAGMVSCAAVAVLVMDNLLISPLHFVSEHTVKADNIMVGELLYTLERPPRFS